MSKPNKPSIALPKTWGGTQTAYTDSQVRDGYSESVPQVIDGGNLNYEKRGLFEHSNYHDEVCNKVVDTPVGKALTTGSNGDFVYEQIDRRANDTEYNAGTSTEKSPTVKQIKESFSSSYAEIKQTQEENDRLYSGVNLQIKFANEISNYANVWAWIKARIQAGNFSGIHIGDYIPVTITAGTVGADSVAAQTFNCQVAGIDTYYRGLDNNLGHHIDFISKEVCDKTVTWNDSNCNNGTRSQPHPWLASKVYAWLNGVNNAGKAYGNNTVGLNAAGKGLYHRLPSDLRNVIVQKRTLLDSRYSANGLLTGGTTWDWLDIGYLWLPNEIEVNGTQIRSNLHKTQGWWNPEAGCSGQYPLFYNSVYRRIKYTSNGERSPWWLASVESNNTGSACGIYGYGDSSSDLTAAGWLRCPLCFRIA